MHTDSDHADRPSLWARQPVLVMSAVAGFFVAVGGALVAIGDGVDPLIAIGMAITEFAVVFGGGKVAQTQAWAPASVNEIIDAETVIAQVQAEG